MGFAVEDFEDLLRLLGEHPEWRQRLRENVLGQDFEELPAIVRDLADTQRRTESRMEELAVRVDGLTSRMDELASQMSQLGEAIRRLSDTVSVAVDALTGRMDDMTREFGYMYEMFFERRAPGVFREWLLRARPVYFDDLPGIEDAQEAGVVSENEMVQLAALDVILFGRFRDTREPGYLAVEVSRTVNIDDVERADERATILRKAGIAARGAVGGRKIAHEAQQVADETGVIVAILRAQPA